MFSSVRLGPPVAARLLTPESSIVHLSNAQRSQTSLQSSFELPLFAASRVAPDAAASDRKRESPLGHGAVIALRFLPGADGMYGKPILPLVGDATSLHASASNADPSQFRP